MPSFAEASEAQVAWLAGLLEGEGYFCLYKSRPGQGRGTGTYFYPRIVVSMSDRDVVERAANLLGSKVQVIDQAKHARAKRKTIYRATVMGSRAAEIMRGVYPLMGERRRQKIDEILAP